MGLNLKRFLNARPLVGMSLAGLLAMSSVQTNAQPSPPAGGQGGGGTGAGYVYQTIANSYLTMYVGLGTTVSGSLGVWTNPSNTTDPFNAIMYGGPIDPTDSPVATPYFGGWLYVRIDDGTTGSLHGKDYIFGDPGSGGWQTPPTMVGNQIQAVWLTKPFSSGSATTTTTTATDVVEIDMVGSFIHDTCRFSFTAKNRTGNSAHKIGLAFLEDIGVQVNTFDLDGPLRLVGEPYLHNESLLTGGQIPRSWSTYVGISPATATAPATYHSIGAQVLPGSSVASEPSPPTRFAYGRTLILEGSDYATGTKVRNFDWLWDFATYIDPTVVLDKKVCVYSTDGTVALIWDEQVVPAGSSINKVAYLGSNTSTTDYTGPMTLSVSSPPALAFVTNSSTVPSTASSTPNPFTITAYVQNISDLNSSGNQFPIPTVNFTIDLPPGLILAPGSNNQQTITGLNPGAEGSVGWSVQLDPNNPQSGTLLYTVTATPNLSTGKAVQRSIQIPAPATVTLDPDSLHPGFYKMLSFSELFGNATPSQILGLPSGANITPQIDSRQWQPTTGHYIEQPTWTPGFAYWIKYTPTNTALTTPQTFVINAGLYPPLDQQVLPTASSYTVTYPVGWNQIGDPYVYNYTFSELQVFNANTLSNTDVVTASSSVNGWLLPAVYYYNTSDPNPANWFYQLEDNLGFQMQQGQGYWIYVEQSNLQFIYNGVDTPGGSVSRAAVAGRANLGLGTTLGKDTTNNWRLNLVAKSTHGLDTLSYIGVAPSATDTNDIYKWVKPPNFNAGTTMDIIHTDWGKANGRFAQDLRSPTLASKTWTVQLTAQPTDKTVTITWPAIAASVPRAYDVYLVDPTATTQVSLRDTSSYVVSMSPGVTRSLTIVAKPKTTNIAPTITSFSLQNTSGRAVGAPASVTISYVLSAEADTQINVRDTRGHIIRTINGTTRSATDTTSGNIGQVVWDVKDQHGVSLTSGTYNVEIVATNGSGQLSRQIKPFVLTR